MKKVLPLLLLAFVMCQCNFQSGQQNQPNENSNRSKYPEKFTEEYIGDRSLNLADKLCNCDPYNVYSFNNVFTKEYGDLLKESLALPEGIDGDGPSAWQWIEFAGELCSLVAVTDINMNGNKAKVIWDSEVYGKDELALSFVDDEWLIDDLGNCSKKYMKDKIQESRKYYKSIDWLEMISELEERGYSKEEAVEASEGLREQIETYFENYPK
ncbi:MAG: hypothetical protein J6P83_01475 [Bacteroidales bacterium]|nr:hypothetical protein [Bacteroidales bacterium]